MANALYTSAKQSILDNNLDLHDGDIRAILVDTDNADSSKKYVVDLDVHDSLDDIASAKRVSAAAVALTTKTVTSGVFDADDVTFAALTSAQNVGAVVLYLHTGTESTSKLLAYIDTGAGFPSTPTGSDFVVRWSNSSNKIFKLV